ncbi:hypothetical protein [Bradyrhizobium embrapense]|uniref:hypothetical protein n=1 Tax=Bradyrhizobium embrapense TaxID=630921 RepID=UPI000AD6A35E|nr:hypothetical protein [Bradyrhizobium embrapense]
MDWVVPIAAGAGVVAALAGFFMAKRAQSVNQTNTALGVAFIGLLIVALCFIVVPISQ